MPKLEDFEVSAYLHSASTRKRPIWYGTVDGRGVTAPCWSKENAIRDAETVFVFAIFTHLDKQQCPYSR